ncbi:hypothetical protein BA190_16270 [Labrys sp. WJW]|nr:hypothetical protein BA190_16270 [Labrys sp. WJW]
MLAALPLGRFLLIGPRPDQEEPAGYQTFQSVLARLVHGPRQETLSRSSLILTEEISANNLAIK